VYFGIFLKNLGVFGYLSQKFGCILVSFSKIWVYFGIFVKELGVFWCEGPKNKICNPKRFLIPTPILSPNPLQKGNVYLIPPSLFPFSHCQEKTTDAKISRKRKMKIIIDEFFIKLIFN
jgi:hypothetical protein